jgi:hypothetical protein
VCAVHVPFFLYFFLLTEIGPKLFGPKRGAGPQTTSALARGARSRASESGRSTPDSLCAQARGASGRARPGETPRGERRSSSLDHRRALWSGEGAGFFFFELAIGARLCPQFSKADRAGAVRGHARLQRWIQSACCFFLTFPAIRSARCSDLRICFLKKHTARPQILGRR